MYDTVPKDHIQNYVFGVSKIMVDFSQKTFNLSKDFTLMIRCDFGENRFQARGGNKYFPKMKEYFPFISLSLFRFTNPRCTRFVEYESFAKDPTIGTFCGNSWEKALNALLAHEIAHAIQYSIKDNEIIEMLGGYSIGHGVFWKNIYTLLRVNFVNNNRILLPESKYKTSFNIKKEKGNYGYVLLK